MGHDVEEIGLNALFNGLWPNLKELSFKNYSSSRISIKIIKLSSLPKWSRLKKLDLGRLFGYLEEVKLTRNGFKLIVKANF